MSLYKIYKDKVPKRLIKESPQLALSELKKKLGEEYINTCFLNSADFKISIEDEYKFKIEDIASEKKEIFTQTEEKKKKYNFLS